MITIPLTQGQSTVIDDCDAELVAGYKWFALWSPNPGSYYAVANIRGVARGKTVRMHRLIMGAECGEYVDHIDHDGLNNRRENLRCCTNRENLQNQRRPHPRNTSGFLGVAPSRGRWRARVQAGGADHRLGTFDTPGEAALARDHFIREHYPSEFWTFNVPLLPGERGIETVTQ